MCFIAGKCVTNFVFCIAKCSVFSASDLWFYDSMRVILWFYGLPSSSFCASLPHLLGTGCYWWAGGHRAGQCPLQPPTSSSDPTTPGFLFAFRLLASLLKRSYFRPLLKLRANMLSTKTFSGYRYMKRRNVIFITEENLVIKSITCIYSPCNLIFVTKQRSKNIPFCLSVTPIRNPPWSHVG